MEWSRPVDTIAGHPIRPMLVPLPIGLWVFSFACGLNFVAIGLLLISRWLGGKLVYEHGVAVDT